MRRSLPILFAALLLSSFSLSAETVGCKDFDPQLENAVKQVA